jgi:peptidoglycan/LPS O-acetylase OafA/YrhL
MLFRLQIGSIFIGAIAGAIGMAVVFAALPIFIAVLWHSSQAANNAASIFLLVAALFGGPGLSGYVAAGIARSQPLMHGLASGVILAMVCVVLPVTRQLAAVGVPAVFTVVLFSLMAIAGAHVRRSHAKAGEREHWPK